MTSNSHLQAGALSTTQLDMGNVHRRNVDGETSLVVAIKENNLKEVRRLLARGATVKNADKHGKTFLLVLLRCFKLSW